MHWSEVWNIASRLPSGKAYKFSEFEFREAAECQLDSAFDRVRHSDILDFAKDLSEQFGVDAQEDQLSGAWTICKR